MSHRYAKTGRSDACSFKGMSGYSIVEILIVLALIAIMTAIALPYFFHWGRMYKTEDQAIKVIDLMREASQRSMNLRRTVRIDLDGNPATPVLRMTDEIGAPPGTLVKTIPLEQIRDVRMDPPAGVAPPNPPNYPNVVFTGGVWSARFRSDGSVVDAANLPISTTLYTWRPKGDDRTPFNITDLTPGRPLETRAITIFGGSGAVRYWRYNGTTFVPDR